MLRFDVLSVIGAFLLLVFVNKGCIFRVFEGGLRLCCVCVVSCLFPSYSYASLSSLFCCHIIVVRVSFVYVGFLSLCLCFCFATVDVVLSFDIDTAILIVVTSVCLLCFIFVVIIYLLLVLVALCFVCCLALFVLLCSFFSQLLLIY